MKTPEPRITRMSLYSPGGERAHPLGQTWIEPESFAYPAGGFTRRAYVKVGRNPHNPVTLPFETYRVVLISIPDTYSTIPARLRVKGKTVKGYVSVPSGAEEYLFTPEANPEACVVCRGGEGCKRDQA